MSSSSDTLLQQLRATASLQLQALEDRVVLVGLSGGADSVALLHVLTELADVLRATIHAAHLDHGLREHSAGDAGRVARLAEDLGVPFSGAREDVRTFATSRRLSIEAAGRQARYSFLAATARKLGAVVAVAHNQNDQAETVLFNLARGAGLSGLTGMDPVGVISAAPDVVLVRPFLGLSSDSIRDYCRRHCLPVLDDPTNASLLHSRNRIRRRVLPELQAVNSRTVEHIALTADVLREDEEALDWIVDRVYEQVVEERAGAVVVATPALDEAPRAVRLRVLRRALLMVAGSVEGVERAHVVSLLELATSGIAGRALHLPRGLRALSGADTVALWQGELDSEALYPLPLLDPREAGGTRLARGWKLEVSHGGCLAPETPRGGLHEHVRRVEQPFELLPAGRLARFRPLGMKTEKHVADFLADRKVPPALRARVPLLVAGGAPVWLLGWRIDERWKLDNPDEPYTCLHVTRA